MKKDFPLRQSRSFLAFAALSGCLAFFGGGCESLSSPESGTPLAVETTPLPLKSDRAELTTNGLNDFTVQCSKINAVIAKQRDTNWCWAACAEMLLRYNGQNVPQEQIVGAIKKRVQKGETADQADLFEIWLAMNPDLLSEMARREAAWSSKPNTIDIGAHVNSMTDPSIDALVQEISSGNPVLLGLQGGKWGGGHVVLAYGIEYSRLNPRGNIAYNDLSMTLFRFSHRFKIHQVMVVDPWPDAKSFDEVNETEFKANKSFIVGKADARKQLQAYMRVYLPTPEEMQHPNR